MADKDFKTIDEQIEILRSRGLTIKDEADAKDFLLRNNYYRVSGYSLTLRKNDVFAKSATFQNIEDIYNFDHEFRHIILHHIETIEVQMKSIYAYEFTKVYGPLGYLDAANFSNQAKHKEIVDKANQQKRQRLAHEAYLKHFINDLNLTVPSGMALVRVRYVAIRKLKTCSGSFGSRAGTLSKYVILNCWDRLPQKSQCVNKKL